MTTTMTCPRNNSRQCENKSLKSAFVCTDLLEIKLYRQCVHRKKWIHERGGSGRWKYRNIECESILGAGMEVGAVGYRCLRHQQPCQNSATHLRVGLESWYQFNEMERSGPSNFIHVNLTQTQWTSSLDWFFHFKRILSEEPFYYFYSLIFFLLLLLVKLPINLRLSLVQVYCRLFYPGKQKKMK